jgi:hypothetical protein
MARPLWPTGLAMAEKVRYELIPDATQDTPLNDGESCSPATIQRIANIVACQGVTTGERMRK